MKRLTLFYQALSAKFLPFVYSNSELLSNPWGSWSIPVLLGLRMDEVTLGQGFLWVRFFLLSAPFHQCSINIFIHHRRSLWQTY